MRRWLSFSRPEYGALAAALASQLAIAVALRLLPFSTVRRVLARTASRTRSEARQDARSVALFTWAADATRRRLGTMSTCLSRALAIQWLAMRRGIDVPVHIGVRRRGAFEAHAWIGTPHEEAGYTRLISFEERAQDGS